MSSLINPENKDLQTCKEQSVSNFSDGGLHVKEDDQDWGSSGMNDIQKDSD